MKKAYRDMKKGKIFFLSTYFSTCKGNHFRRNLQENFLKRCPFFANILKGIAKRKTEQE